MLTEIDLELTVPKPLGILHKRGLPLHPLRSNFAHYFAEHLFLEGYTIRLYI